MIKIWGTAFSLIGDLIMSLPQLNYYKSKHKDIYVNFVIHKKISYCAPLFFNHPLIDNFGGSHDAFIFKSDILKRNIKLSVSNAALRTVDYKGGLDFYLKHKCQH